MKTLPEKIEVMQAALDGAEIEFQNNGSLIWTASANNKPKWQWDNCDYRIKPEPMEFWVNISNGLSSYMEIHGSEEQAIVAACHGSVKTIKVREVIE